MIKIWNLFVSFAESVQTARAAAALSRMGRHEEARKLMTSKLP